MIRELRDASELLKTALEQYRNTCLAVSSRGEFASVLSDASETVLEELKAIASYEAHLENSKKAIHRLRNRCTRIAPVNILPPELLTQIFYFAFQPECMFQSGRATNDLSVCQRLLITPLRVCSYWRYVALHSGVFWTHIDVGAAKPKESLSVKQAKCILPYSGGRPLDIHIKMAHNAGPLITPDIREFCILSAPKAALISLCNTDSQEDVHTAVIGLLLSNCTPGNLTHLASIYGVYRASSLMVALDTTEQIDPSVRCTRICVLHDHLEEVLRCVTSLHLKNRILHWKSKAYTGLVRLQVDHAFGIYTTSQLAHILNASPLLRFLRLGFSLIKDGNSAEPVPVQMEHLEALSLFADRLEDHDQVLRLIIPGSKAIRLSTVVTEEETPFLTSREHKRFFERSNVTQLHAVMAPVPVGDLSQPLVLSELLSLIPNLETLSLGMFDIVCGNRPSMSPGGTLYGERLTRLQLVDSAIDLDEICKIINEYPITRLAIELEADLLDLGDEISDEEAFKEELLEMFPDLEFFVQGDPNDVDWD